MTSVEFGSLGEIYLKKVGVLSFYHKNYNYGGILQAYATVTILNNLGYDSQQISFLKTNKQIGILKKLLLMLKKHKLNIFVYVLKKGIHKIKLKAKKIIYKSNHLFSTRFLKYDEFMNHIPHTKDVYTVDTISKTNDFYDIFVVGSDQVWNPDIVRNSYFLEYVQDNKLKISYAASLAKNNLDAEEKKIFEIYLSSFNGISVREKTAKVLLSKITHHDVQVVLDPTLVLDKNHWKEKLSPVNVPKKYIFVYLLGENAKHRVYIRKLAKLINYSIICIPHARNHFCLSDVNFADIDFMDAGPADFLSLIYNASMVITDSFHACAFSINFNKQFLGVKRFKDNDPKSMNSRLTDLLEEFDLCDRLVDCSQELNLEYITKEIDYKRVNEKLETLREKSMKFLVHALASK